MTKPAPFIIVALLTIIALGVLFLSISAASANRSARDRDIRACVYANPENANACIGR